MFCSTYTESAECAVCVEPFGAMRCGEMYEREREKKMICEMLVCCTIFFVAFGRNADYCEIFQWACLSLPLAQLKCLSINDITRRKRHKHKHNRIMCVALPTDWIQFCSHSVVYDNTKFTKFSLNAINNLFCVVLFHLIFWFGKQHPREKYVNNKKTRIYDVSICRFGFF